MLESCGGRGAFSAEKSSDARRVPIETEAEDEGCRRVCGGGAERAAGGRTVSRRGSGGGGSSCAEVAKKLLASRLQVAESNFCSPASQLLAFCK